MECKEHRFPISNLCLKACPHLRCYSARETHTTDRATRLNVHLYFNHWRWAVVCWGIYYVIVIIVYIFDIVSEGNSTFTGGAAAAAAAAGVACWTTVATGLCVRLTLNGVRAACLTQIYNKQQKTDAEVNKMAMMTTTTIQYHLDWLPRKLSYTKR